MIFAPVSMVTSLSSNVFEIFFIYRFNTRRLLSIVATIFPSTSRMSVCQLVQRFERAIKSRNEVLTKLISKEISLQIPKLRPVDLVNISKIYSPLAPAILSECRDRKFAKFKSQDFTILAEIAKDDQIYIDSISARVDMFRTCDLCYVLWKVADPQVRQRGLEEMKNRDLSTLSFTNFTQLLKVVCSESSRPIAPKLLSNLIRELSTRISSVDSKTLPFILYCISETVSKNGTTIIDEHFVHFFTLVNSQLSTRTDIKPLDFVDCVRALGRIRQLEKKLFEEKFIKEVLPFLKPSDLDNVRLKGLENAAATVGYNNSFKLVVS